MVQTQGSFSQFMIKHGGNLKSNWEKCNRSAYFTFLKNLILDLNNFEWFKHTYYFNLIKWLYILHEAYILENKKVYLVYLFVLQMTIKPRPVTSKKLGHCVNKEKATWIVLCKPHKFLNSFIIFVIIILTSKRSVGTPISDEKVFFATKIHHFPYTFWWRV